MFDRIHLWSHLVLDFCLLGGFWIAVSISLPTSLLRLSIYFLFILGRFYVSRNNLSISSRLSNLLAYNCFYDCLYFCDFGWNFSSLISNFNSNYGLHNTITNIYLIMPNISIWTKGCLISAGSLALLSNPCIYLQLTPIKFPTAAATKFFHSP